MSLVQMPSIRSPWDFASSLLRFVVCSETVYLRQPALIISWPYKCYNPYRFLAYHFIVSPVITIFRIQRTRTHAKLGKSPTEVSVHTRKHR